MKVIPVYLPQFHTIPENDQWWGIGFTEWVNVKKAVPLFDGHYQPRVPLNRNYYDLSRVETLKWQADLANRYGIYGFCMYHYWFNGHLLLEKPMEMLLAHPEINLRYCISWANHDWTDGWKANGGQEHLLIGHDFDDEKDWVRHFNYMLPFFKDPRYISENNKPLMIVYIPNLIRKLNKMLDLWNGMAKDAGFDGLTFLYQSAMCCFDTNWDRSRFEYEIQFQPGYVAWAERSGWKNDLRWKTIKYLRPLKRLLGIRRTLRPVSAHVEFSDYDAVWEKILSLKPGRLKTIPSAFVDWDNTPRKQQNGSVYRGAEPGKFKKYFRQLVENTRDVYQQDKIFVFAWNEWAEGGYLEPDERFGYGYLEAIRSVLEETGELP